MSIKGSVTIKYNADGSVTLDPPVGKLDRVIQTMQWTLVAPEGVKFADPGIVFKEMPHLPDGFSNFPGLASNIVREGDRHYRAKTSYKIATDGPMQRYKYDIVLDTPDKKNTKIEVCLGAFGNTTRKIDPDMENEPEP